MKRINYRLLTKDDPQRVQFLNTGKKRKVCPYCHDRHYNDEDDGFCTKRCKNLFLQEKSKL